jgi:predicted peptidase
MRRALLFTCFVLFISSDSNAQSRPASQPRPQILEGTAKHDFRVRYLLFLPADYETKPDARWPLILYLHGGSLRGTNIESVRTLGLPHKTEAEPNFPFVVVSPQCAAGEIWTDVDALVALMDHVEADYRIDPDRIYLTGHSMGGRGALYLAYRQPQRFAAVIALSPLSPITAWKENLAKVPLWILHGKADTLAPVADTQELVSGIEAVGGHPRLDILPERDHFILDIYDRPELYEWLIKHKRDGKQSGPSQKQQ